MSQDDIDDDNRATTGHEWDGIKEFDNPMPRWWLWTFYATIFWGLIYTILFPAWPMISGATPGLLGYSSRGEVAEDIEAAAAANADLDAELVATPLEEVADNPDLLRYASAGGAAVFRTYCSQCHGSGAAGAAGYPNLLDDEWLWGGSVEAIHETIAHGIRNEDDPDARWSEMPAFGRDEILTDEEIRAVTEYVVGMSGREHDDALAETGATIFEEQCAACHGENGMGMTDLGAPNLNNAVWLYGGDRETLIETITYSRFGVMPPWQDRLTDAQLAQVTTYVHQLGGGE